MITILNYMWFNSNTGRKRKHNIYFKLYILKKRETVLIRECDIRFSLGGGEKNSEMVIRIGLTQ